MASFRSSLLTTGPARCYLWFCPCFLGSAVVRSEGDADDRLGARAVHRASSCCGTRSVGYCWLVRYCAAIAGGGRAGVAGCCGRARRDLVVTAVPSAPFVESVAAEGLGVLVAWAPNPANDHVTSYSVTATPASGSSTSACSSPTKVTASVPVSDTGVVVGGLCAGVVYTAQVVAVNSAGSSAASAVSDPVVPLVAQAPDSPLITSVTGRNGELLVGWAAPVYDGGDAVSGYTLTAKHSTQVVTVPAAASALSATVSGLTDATSYSLSLTASNAVGASNAASGSGTPEGVYAPSPPVDLTTVPDGTGGVGGSWQSPSDGGGGAVSGYTISYQQQQQSKAGVWSAVSGAPVETLAEAASATSATVTSFPASPAFFLFSVTASNSAGTTVPSSS